MVDIDVQYTEYMVDIDVQYTEYMVDIDVQYTEYMVGIVIVRCSEILLKCCLVLNPMPKHTTSAPTHTYTHTHPQ